MVAVSVSAFDVTGELATVGLLRDNMLNLLCLTSTAPLCHLVML